MRRTLALTLSLTLAPASAFAQSDYDDAMAAAAQREGAGHPREAAATLDPLHARYPQDYALALRLGWLWFQAGEAATARRRYEVALSLSDGSSRDARLGLAWSLLRTGDTTAAQTVFEALVAGDGSDAAAREGLAAARAAYVPRLRVWAGLWVGAQLWAAHPTRTWSLSVTPTVAAQLWGWGIVALTYRAVGYSTTQTFTPPRPPPGAPPPPQGIATQTRTRTATQQEFYAAAGVARRTWALRAHLGYVWDADNTMAPAWVFGASGRVTLRGELAAEVGATAFSDYTVTRALAQWGAALGRGFTLGPILAGQYGNGAWGGSIGALAGWSRDGYAVNFSARYGDERRPTSLTEALAWASDDRVRIAATLGAILPLGGGLSLALRYDALALQTTASTGGIDASAHFLTAALTGAW